MGKNVLANQRSEAARLEPLQARGAIKGCAGDEAWVGKGDACVRPRGVVAGRLHQFYWRQRVS